ncbi:unnamed protein product, partial [Medioppia subpectinata]
MHPDFHPSIPSIYGSVELELKNRSCHISADIPHISLKTLISDSGPLQESDVSVIGAQLVLALNHLHDNGVVHRCLNPELASLDWRGRVRITDLS